MPDFQLFRPEEIASLRRGGKILRACLNLMETLVEPGITTGELDRKAEEFIRSHEGAEPGFKGYHGFPATLCTSVNEECVHGIPGERELIEGDIVAVDCGVLLDGLYTDACVTVAVGEIAPETQKLLDVSQEALEAGISVVKEGAHVGDISSIVQTTLEKRGFKPVRQLTGHGLGSTLHQFPDVPNLGTAGTGPVLPKDTIIAIEPIVSAGSDTIREAKDGWTLSIEDGALSAHFEHTVLITEEGCEIIA